MGVHQKTIPVIHRENDELRQKLNESLNIISRQEIIIEALSFNIKGLREEIERLNKELVGAESYIRAITG